MILWITDNSSHIRFDIWHVRQMKSCSYCIIQKITVIIITITYRPCPETTFHLLLFLPAYLTPFQLGCSTVMLHLLRDYLVMSQRGLEYRCHCVFYCWPWQHMTKRQVLCHLTDCILSFQSYICFGWWHVPHLNLIIDRRVEGSYDSIYAVPSLGTEQSVLWLIVSEQWIMAMFAPTCWRQSFPVLLHMPPCEV